MLRLLQEGNVKFYAHVEGKISSGLPVFYNPGMKLARDVAVDVVGKLKPASVCCLMDASGIRSLRFYKEAGIRDIAANDISNEACRLMKRNFALNKAKIRIVGADANAFLRGSEGFDFIDLDPFGSPIKFLGESAAKVRKGGVIAVTATDIGCLSGRFEDACMRKYFIKSMQCPFSKELAMRILISKVQGAAAVYGKSLVPVMAHYDSHYIRVYLRNAGALHDVMSNQGFVFFCRKCLRWKTSAAPVSGSCPCGWEFDWAGPLWLGPLFDRSLATGIIPRIREEAEVDVLGFYDMHKLAKKLKFAIPRIDPVIERIRSLGFRASRTHFTPVGIRSDIPYEKFVEIIS